jgi:hypothetical protein
MLLFLASVLEQLDLALEHVVKGDVHNARFALMLTDNALELVLHQIALDKRSELKAFSWRNEIYPHQTALDKALGQSFGEKVSFARLIDKMSEETSQTARIMHGFRNEVYHVGLQHQTILPTLAKFYFHVSCSYLSAYRPNSLGWSSNQKIPERAAKYIKEHPLLSPSAVDDFSDGCELLANSLGYDAAATILVLADHLDEVIEEQNTCIDILAEGAYAHQRTTRDDAVIRCQTWPLVFSAEGIAFANKRGFTGNRFEFIEWLGANYPLKFRGDPVQNWRRRAGKIRSEKNPHAVLRHFKAFMSETESIRHSIMESAAACEAEIESAIDRARGK